MYGTRTTIVSSIIQIKVTLGKLWPGRMTHPWVTENNCLKYYPYPTWQKGVMAWTRTFSICALTFNYGMMHPWVTDNNCVKYYPDQTWQWGVMVQTRLWVYMHCDLDLEVKVMTHPLGMANNCVKNYPDPTWKWKIMVQTRISGMYIVFTVTLTLGTFWVKVMTYS